MLPSSLMPSLFLQEASFTGLMSKPTRFAFTSGMAMKKNGLIIISVPNIANIYIRLMLLFGIFNYTDRGILDRTHLKFFTNKSLHQLCQNVGYIIKEKMTTPIPLEIIFPGLIKVKKQHFLTKLIYKLTSLRPSLFGYQFIVVICKDK